MLVDVLETCVKSPSCMYSRRLLNNNVPSNDRVQVFSRISASTSVSDSCMMSHDGHDPNSFWPLSTETHLRTIVTLFLTTIYSHMRLTQKTMLENSIPMLNFLWEMCQVKISLQHRQLSNNGIMAHTVLNRMRYAPLCHNPYTRYWLLGSKARALAILLVRSSVAVAAHTHTVSQSYMCCQSARPACT